MLLTIFLSLIVCVAATVMMVSAVAFIQKREMFSSAPKEVFAIIKPREKELFCGARNIGWVLMGSSLLMILGVFVIGIWDGFRSGFTFLQFFLRFLIIFTVYKLYDMTYFDYFFLLRFGFFQYYYPEANGLMDGRKYGFNIKSQLLKLLVIFPGISALIAWVCSMIART